MILVDTSVWIDHLRAGEPALADLLEANRVLMHPFVLGELACGTLKNRTEILYYLRHLPEAPVAMHAEVLHFMEQHQLMGRGLGYVDIHLLAAVALVGTARLWTRDKRLAAAAASLGLAVTTEKV